MDACFASLLVAIDNVQNQITLAFPSTDNMPLLPPSPSPTPPLLVDSLSRSHDNSSNNNTTTSTHPHSNHNTSNDNNNTSFPTPLPIQQHLSHYPPRLHQIYIQPQQHKTTNSISTILTPQSPPVRLFFFVHNIIYSPGVGCGGIRGIHCDDDVNRYSFYQFHWGLDALLFTYDFSPPPHQHHPSKLLQCYQF
ncbi:UNVERIFIED_CONTAM: hypothetical protein Sradi_4900400 [Sesamum radiatum]|uniref:Uncharacterized protein n=1 Tax=Sesamum radiatum TaxID=300843 RepID=A0AAW2MCW6_SESRA